MIHKTILLTLIGVGLFMHSARAQSPVANFTASPVGGCSPLVVNFTDSSSGAPTGWSWNFGNGATSTLKNPSTTYFIPGTYTVTLTVTNATGSNTLTRQQLITVYGKPAVSFSGSDSLGCYPFPVKFTDGSSAGVGTTNTTWFWDMGDGRQATEQHPQNTYLNTGNYTVSLKVTNDKGCWSTATKPAYIKINGGVKAAFASAAQAVCHTPVNVNFTNTSTGPGTLSYQWIFGDGGTSATINPTYIYAAPGIYSVALVAISSSGCRDTVRQPALFDFQNITTSFTAPDSACARDGISFTNTSTSNSASTVWTFGDGTGSTSVSGVKAYTAPGTYTVKLQQNYGTCVDSALKTIYIKPRPTAAFTANKTVFCQLPAAVNFSNSSQDGVSYQWFFGDGAVSTASSPSHSYTDWGSFDVTLIVTSGTGCNDTIKKPGYIKISKPVIRFPSLPVQGCIPYSVNFAAAITTSDPVASYLWDFGNGTTSTAAIPAYTYTTQGTYTVKLTITTVDGCTETYTMPAAVTVGIKPTVSFTALPTPVCAMKPVAFTSTGTGGTEWLWTFGDGGTSSQQNPLYQYADTGIFNVTLYVTSNGCRDSLKIDSLIRVKPPIAQFISQNTCSNKLHFVFTDRSIGATTWLWNFGDGITSTQKNPVHDFAAYGTYTVTLTVSNDTCQNQKTQTIKIVNGTPDFTALPTTACKGSTINFSADTTNSANIISYQWNFGHGGTGSSGITTSTIYSNAGTYPVSLIVTDVAGCVDSTVKKAYIKIKGPAARFTVANNNGCRGLTATFTDASLPDGASPIINWKWNLGDGTVINNRSAAAVQHTYTTAGSFPVSLKLTDAGGCTDSLLRPALVNVSNIKADFFSIDTLSCPGATIHFTNTSTATTTYTSSWNFGTASVSSQPSPTTSYTTDGQYSIQLKIKDAFGCSDSIAKPKYITIKHPEARFTVSDTASSCTPFQVHFTNTSSFFTGFIWNLGGGTSSLANPTQYYNQPGVFHTSLVVTSAGGCKDTADQAITVYNVKNAAVTYLPLSGCKPLTVDLHALAPAQMTTVWDFGDGTIISSNDTMAQHIYHSFGDFVPKLILADASGCVIPVTGLDTIRIQGATTRFGVSQRVLCDSGTIHFIDSTTFNNPIISYAWDFGDGAVSSLSSPSHYYGALGVYPVSLNVLTQNSCVDTFHLSVPVKVVASPDAKVAGDSVICIGEGMNHIGLFNRTDTSGVQWAWQFPNGNTAAVQVPEKQYYTKAGRFIVQSTVTNSSGCAEVVRKNIRVNPLPSVALPPVLTTRTGSPVQLPATYTGGVVSYSWTMGESLSCTACPEPVASPKFNTTYRVSFTDTNGCRNKGEVKVIVFCNNDNVFVPNTFSPNGDGSNDVFYVRGKGLNRVKSLRIFNRWGQVIFERLNFAVNDASVGWDGTYKGSKPVPDVYVYQMEVWCDNSTVVSFDGNVALIE